VSLKLQKRLAASILGCGEGKVWLDPLETSDISMANSRQNIRRLVRDGLILKKPPKIHSRSRVRARDLAKSKGRHTGPGKRKGKKGARMPRDVLWLRRVRVLRRMLKKYRKAGKIDAHLYHDLYLRVKGNVFKNKKTLMEHIHKAKNELKREKALSDQAAARRDRNKKRRAVAGGSKALLAAQQAAAAAQGATGDKDKAVQKAAGQTKKAKAKATAPAAAAPKDKKAAEKKADKPAEKKADKPAEKKAPAPAAEKKADKPAAKAAAKQEEKPAKKEEKKAEAKPKAAAEAPKAAAPVKAAAAPKAAVPPKEAPKAAAKGGEKAAKKAGGKK